MPTAGQTKPGFAEHCTPARRSFAARFADLIDFVPGEKQYRKARTLGIEPCSLSQYRRGSRVPDARRLAAMYDKVARFASGSPDLVALPELEGLRAAAALRHATTCQPKTTTEVVPYTEPRNGNCKDSTGASRSRDRRNAANKRVVHTVAAITAHQAAGRRRDLLNLIWVTGSSQPPSLIAGTACELHRCGQRDTAAALVASTRHRDHAYAMQLALDLIELKLPHYAETVMRASLQTAA